MSEIEKLSLELMALEEQINVVNKNARRVAEERRTIMEKCKCLKQQLAVIERELSEHTSHTIRADEYLSENHNYITALKKELFRKQETIDRARDLAKSLLDGDSGENYHETAYHIIEVLSGMNSELEKTFIQKFVDPYL